MTPTKIVKASDGTLRKYDIGGGRWRWRGSFYIWYDDGSRKSYSKMLGECNAPTKAERETMRSKRTPAPRGKGAMRAKADLVAWRLEKIEELEAELAEAALPDESKLCAMDFVNAYIRIREKDIEPSTAEGYRYATKHMDPTVYPMLDRPVSKLTPRILKAWLDAMEVNKVPAPTRRRAYSRLSSAFNWAVAMQMLSSNPCRAVESPKFDRRGPNPMDENTVARLNTALDALPPTESNGDFTIAVRLALFTGMRRGEVCGLRWQDVDGWQDGSFEGDIHVRSVITHVAGGTNIKGCPKSGHERDVPINSDIRALLASRREAVLEERRALKLSDDLSGVFVAGRADGTYLTPTVLSRRWNAFSNDFDLRGVSGKRAHYHDLRHTYATHAITSGVDVATVASILGHADGNITMSVYTSFLPSKKAEAMESMEGKFTGRADLADVLPFETAAG